MNAFDSHFFVMEYRIEKGNEKSYISYERSYFMSSMFHSSKRKLNCPVRIVGT